LAARGISEAGEARSLLNPTAWQPCGASALPALETASELVADAIQRRRRIAVFGDYDADGVTATAVLTRHLRMLGGNVVPFLPRRLEDGYGLTVPAARRCMDTLAPDLVITVDCGTSSRDAVRAISSAGAEVIVTDHHLPDGDCAAAAAIVNPHLAPAAPPLAGVGVALELALAVSRRLDREPCGRVLNPLLELAAIGTVADCVPLTGANRAIVRAGLAALQRTSFPGLRALMEQARTEFVRSTWEIAFLLAPRLNAAGRIEAADVALDLLLTDDFARAAVLARQLEDANRERQQIERRLLESAIHTVERDGLAEHAAALVLSGADWHLGVIGIVATRLVARYGRPIAIISIQPGGPARGSVRGIEGVDVTAALRECSPLLVRYGGHSQAAGLELDPKLVPKFAAAFDHAVRQQIGGGRPQRSLHVDSAIGLGDITEELLDWIERLEPYGYGFPPPMWAAFDVEVTDWRIVQTAHVRMELRQGSHRMQAIAFRQADRPRPGGTVDVAFELKRNSGPRDQAADLVLSDWRERAVRT